MIGFTKLLCGTATVSGALRQVSQGGQEPGLLQFTTADRPLVVWNMTTRCNLRCVHCYNDSSEASRRPELTTAEAEALIDDLSQMGVPVLLFSGGEPVLRPDGYQLGRYASDRGLRAVLSTNGTLITPEVAQRLKDAGFQYVGISIDGLAERHDAFRRKAGASAAAWDGLRNARTAGLRSGVRFTVTRDNADDLPGVIGQAVAEQADRFCLYHLVYAGRGADLPQRDLSAAQRRELIQWLIGKTKELHQEGRKIEILTTDNHADGIYLYREIAARDPGRAEEVLQLLAMHGGCSAGRKFANIDVTGDVHACQFWGHESLGNVRDRPFSAIWNDSSHPLMGRLKQMPLGVGGRCGECGFKDYCGGCRIRAAAIHGDPWGADPTCYLTDDEISGPAPPQASG
ncbi:MAG: radical SAM protein [Armatimonadota bacterium]|nr:MAG: radical SAM protein [Armatimonadota bacterium]